MKSFQRENLAPLSECWPLLVGEAHGDLGHLLSRVFPHKEPNADWKNI